jgi:hypothetical protein
VVAQACLPNLKGGISRRITVALDKNRIPFLKKRAGYGSSGKAPVYQV